MNKKNQFDSSLLDLAKERSRQGRPVTLADLFMLKEAIASCSIEQPTILETVPVDDNSPEILDIKEGEPKLIKISKDHPLGIELDIEPALNWDSDLEQIHKASVGYHWAGYVFRDTKRKVIIARIYICDMKCLITASANIETLEELNLVAETVRYALPEYECDFLFNFK